MTPSWKHHQHHAPAPNSAVLPHCSRTWFFMSQCTSFTRPRRLRHVVSGRVPLSSSSQTVGHSGDRPSVTSLLADGTATVQWRSAAVGVPIS